MNTVANLKLQKQNRMTVSDGLGIFLGFIFGLLIICLGGLVSLLFPVAGTMIMLIGCAVYVLTIIWGLANG